MYRDVLRQNRSRELVDEFLERFIERHGWWAARAGWIGDDGMLLDRWRVSTHAPSVLSGLGDVAMPTDPIEPGGERFTEPALRSVGDVSCTRSVAAELAAAGVSNLVVVDVPAPAGLSVRVVLVGPSDNPELEMLLQSLRTGVQLLPTVLRQEVERGELRVGALRDPLTGLLNRAGLDELAAAVVPGADVRAVLYIDLDGFKAVNDAHGHAAGDALLLDTADRLTRQVRPTDLVARVGGDEFVVVATSVLDDESVVTLAQRLIAALSHDTILSTGAVVSVAASAGVALWGADARFTDAVADADALMYEAKRIGGGIAMQDAAGRVLVRDPFGHEPSAEEVERGRAPLRVAHIHQLHGVDDWGLHVLLRGELSTAPCAETLVLIDAALAAQSLADPPSRIVLEPRGRGWSREGLLLELVAGLRERFSSTEILLLVDAHASATELRLVAEEIRARLGVGLVLGGVGASSGGDLRTIAQTAPAVLALDREAVLNLDRTQPRGISATLAAALAAAIGAELLVIDPPEGVDAERLTAWGCTLAVMPRDTPDRSERTS